jgi:hypothetical protein
MLSRAWRGRTVRRALLVAGVAAAGVYVVGDMVSGLVYEGYSFKDQWISELTAHGSPVRALMLGFMTAHGLLGAALAVGIWRSAGQSRSLRWVGPLLIAAGAIGFLTHVVFPMTSRWIESSFSDAMHATLTMAWGVTTFTAMILSAVAYRGWFRLYSIVTLLVMIGFGVASSIAIQGIEENNTPWAGAFERANAYALMAWLIVIAMTVMRRSLRDVEPESGGARVEARTNDPYRIDV